LHEERAVLQRQAAHCGSIFHEEASELTNEARLMQAWRTEVNATLQDEVTTMRRVFVEDAEAHAARCAQVLSSEQARMHEWANETRTRYAALSQQVVNMEAKQVADQQQILHRLTEQGKLRQQLTHAEKEIMDRTEKAQHALYEAQMRETKLNTSEIAMAQSNVQGRIKIQEMEMALSSTTNELEQSLYQLSHAQQSHRTFGHESQTADARYQEAAASMQAKMHHLEGESQIMARQLER
jgi:hypothetical protein